MASGRGGGGARIQIVHLADVPEAFPLLARWFVAEWEPYYGAAGPGDALGDLRACRNRDGLPLALVALDAEGKVLGTAALKAASLASHGHLGPWLAALLVAQGRRGEGIGSALVEAIEGEARRLDFDALFCGASRTTTLLRRRGWRVVEDGVPTLRAPTAVYRLDLGGA